MSNTRTLFPPPAGWSGLGRAATLHQLQDQSVAGTVAGRGITRTTRGTFVRGQYAHAPRGWPGYAVVSGYAYKDADSSSCPVSASNITDNSGGAKTWLVVNVAVAPSLGTAVTYESGPPPSPMPDNQEWYYVAHLVDVPRVTRFG